MKKFIVALVILSLINLNLALSQNQEGNSRSLRGYGEEKKIDQKFSTKPKDKSVLGPGVTENIDLRPTKQSAYKNYFNDPEWTKQWYMHDYRTADGPVMDHNVVPVYERHINGQGVMVIVVDDGVVQNHYDLMKNYASAYSVTCAMTDIYQDGSPDYVADFGWEKHGTMVAGIIGMDANDKCGVGIAHKATLASINVYHGWYTKDKYIRKALEYNTSWDVFCIGWGLPSSAFSNAMLRPEIYGAISDGFTKGRNNKGAIYVTTPGMSKEHENCYIDPLANHPDTFAFGVATNRGKIVSAYDTPVRCAAIIAAAYGGGVDDDDEGMVTISPVEDPKYESGCTRAFRSASVGSAIASSIIALVLSAKPSLTSHDVMHLIAAGSEVAPLANNAKTWSVNKAGFWFSNDFGFGLLNAENMVDLALNNWKSVGERHVCFINKNLENYMELPKNTEISITLQTDGCQGSGATNAIFYLEQIQLETIIDYSKSGAPSIAVVSAEGTASQILQPPAEKDKMVVKHRVLKSYHYWGENPKGEWIVKIKIHGVKGRLKDLRITLYGTKEKPAYYKDKTPYRNYSAFRIMLGDKLVTVE